MKDKREEEFNWWHNAVFGPQSFKAAIPHQVTRDYLDWRAEVERNRQLNGDMAMREVTITGDWVEHLPQPMRRDMVRDIFSLASQFGWVIRVDGQHWEQEQQS